MKRKFVILLILILVLLSFSCRKREGKADIGPQAEAEPSTLPETETTGDVTSYEEVTEKTEEVSVNEFYRGGDILIKAEFSASSGVLSFNITDEEIKRIITLFASSSPDTAGSVFYTLENGELSLTYTERTEEEIEEEWREFKTFLNSYNGEKEKEEEARPSADAAVTLENETVKGTLSAGCYPGRAEITIPEGMTEDELSSFISFLVDEYPEVTGYGTLTAGEGVLTLTYSSFFTGEDAESLFSALTYLVDEYFTSSAPDTEDAGEEVNAETVPALTEEGKKIRKFSLSIVLQNSLDAGYMKSFSQPYVPSALLRIDYSIRDNFSLGVVSGYDWSGYVPFGVSARYHTRILPGFYIEGTFGGNIGVGGNMNYGEYFTLVSLGYEYSFDDRWSLFFSADFLYRWGTRGRAARFGLSLGSRVRF